MLAKAKCSESKNPRIARRIDIFSAGDLEEVDSRGRESMGMLGQLHHHPARKGQLDRQDGRT